MDRAARGAASKSSILTRDLSFLHCVHTHTHTHTHTHIHTLTYTYHKRMISQVRLILYLHKCCVAFAI